MSRPNHAVRKTLLVEGQSFTVLAGERNCISCEKELKSRMYCSLFKTALSTTPRMVSKRCPQCLEAEAKN